MSLRPYAPIAVAALLLAGCGPSVQERTSKGMDTLWGNAVVMGETDQLCWAWQEVPEEIIASTTDGFSHDPSYGPDFHPDRKVIASYLDLRCGGGHQEEGH